MKINKIIVLGTVLVAGYAAKNASADMVTYTDTFGPQTTPFSDLLTFDKFNTSFGTLTGIQITLDTTEVADVAVYNILGTSLGFTGATASIPITASALSGVTTSVSGTAGPISGTAAPGLNSYMGVTASQTGTTAVPSADFGSYEGSGFGTFLLTVNGAQGVYSGSGPFGLFFGGSAVANGDVKVTYDYTPSAVPDSAVTLSLVGGIFGMIAVSRKLRTIKV